MHRKGETQLDFGYALAKVSSKAKNIILLDKGLTIKYIYTIPIRKRE
jgi:hypothetical protein